MSPVDISGCNFLAIVLYFLLMMSKSFSSGSRPKYSRAFLRLFSMSESSLNVFINSSCVFFPERT